MKAINVQHSLKPPLSEIIFNEYAVKGSGLLKTILPPCNKMNVYRQTEHTARLRWGIAAEKLLWQFRVIKWTGTNDLWVWGMSLIQNYFRGKCCSCCRVGANGSSAKDKMWQARGIKCDVWKWKWVTRQRHQSEVSKSVSLFMCQGKGALYLLFPVTKPQGRRESRTNICFWEREKCRLFCKKLIDNSLTLTISYNLPMSQFIVLRNWLGLTTTLSNILLRQIG